MFVSSEIVKWNINELKLLYRFPTYYSIGHLCVPGGPTKKPHGKYVIAYNKITKDRYLPLIVPWRSEFTKLSKPTRRASQRKLGMGCPHMPTRMTKSSAFSKVRESSIRNMQR